MIEIFLAMLAAAVQSTATGDSAAQGPAATGPASQGSIAALQAPSPGAADMTDRAETADMPAPPAFLSPDASPDANQAPGRTPGRTPGPDASAAETAAPPAFLAPQPAAEAPPAFLSPDPESAAAPAFPSPQLQAEPQVPSGLFTTATEVRPILDVTRNNWIALREFNGQDLVYVTHLWSWRCGLAELRLGINGAPPEPWPLPPCHLDRPAPNAILESDGLPYRPFALGSVAMIEVHLTYDDLGTDQARFNRQGVRIP